MCKEKPTLCTRGGELWISHLPPLSKWALKKTLCLQGPTRKGCKCPCLEQLILRANWKFKALGEEKASLPLAPAKVTTLPASDLRHVRDCMVQSPKSQTSLPHPKHKCQLGISRPSRNSDPSSSALPRQHTHKPKLRGLAAYLPNHHFKATFRSDFAVQGWGWTKEHVKPRDLQLCQFRSEFYFQISFPKSTCTPLPPEGAEAPFSRQHNY